MIAMDYYANIQLSAGAITIVPAIITDSPDSIPHCNRQCGAAAAVHYIVPGNHSGKDKKSESHA
jgi:hypothetical protein